MRTAFLPPCVFILATLAFAATDVQVNFTLNTTGPTGTPIRQSRHYYVYRPDNLSKSTAVPAVLFLEASAGGAASFFHRQADQAGFVVVSCSFSGNSTGTPGTSWNGDDPRNNGFEDYDYLTEVIHRVQSSDNVNDVFISGFSKGGHMSMAYACLRPSTVKGAGSIDESLILSFNIPSAPVPVIAFHGSLDTVVGYALVKDSVDTWRAVDGLSNAPAVTTYESSPLIPGRVTQSTWRGGIGGAEVAFVTIVGGTHTYSLPNSQTGYDCTYGLWTFFSQFLTNPQDAPKVVSQPVDNVQIAGQAASFWAIATGSGPLTYQWQKNGKDIPEATASWYTTPASILADNGATFQAVIGNGSGTVTSAPATLTVNAAPPDPTITTQPADQSAIAGQPVTFTVAASGAPPLTYQWQKNGMDIVGATDASLTIPAAITADSGATFNVVVKGRAGAVTSAKAALNVAPAPGAPILLQNPARPRVVPGQPATASVTAWSLLPMTYQWQKGAFTGNMVDIPGATLATYTMTNPKLSDHLTLLRCVVSNAAGSATSADEMLFVTASPTSPRTITSPAAVYAQSGVPFTYTITSWGGSSPVSYTANPLPPGLSLNPATGEISGTPLAAGENDIAIDASNIAGHASTTLALTVTEKPPQVPVDAWRFANFGASAIDPSIAGDLADPDGDGYTNLEEFIGGSNPLDPASVPGAPAGSPSPANRSRAANLGGSRSLASRDR